MKRIALVTALALVLTACGASTPPPKLTPPSSDVVALAHPPVPGVDVPAPIVNESLVRTLDHKYWSIQVPTKWDVVDDNEEGVILNRVKAPGVLPASIQVISQVLNDTLPEQFVMIVSTLAESQVPKGTHVTDVVRKAGLYRGHTSSLTQVNTDRGVFLGVLAMVDEANKTGYAVIAIAPMTPDDGRLMGKISQTFELKTAAPPQAEEPKAAPPAKPTPKATPKKK
jgi:hypothetical protein